MSHILRDCPDCQSMPAAFGPRGVDRRRFLQLAGAGAAAVAAGSIGELGHAALDEPSSPESVVKLLHESLSEAQRQKICFAWDFKHPDMGLLRTRVSNNWHITDPDIDSDFFTGDQRAMIRDIFEGLIQPDWHARIDKQLEDDAGGFGRHQNIAIFGSPGEGQYEFVMTGRHMTLRCDGNSADHVAFGGPLFYGHAATGFDEPADHEGNVFWHQALEANKLFEMLDGRQREAALIAKLPKEEAVAFRGASELPGLRVSEMSSDQRGLVQHVLQTLIEPYRQSDRDEVVACLSAQGGLDGCALSFYQEGDIGDDRVWDCWRLEGPSFVWYFRGTPHVHVWVNVASDPTVETNA